VGRGYHAGPGGSRAGTFSRRVRLALIRRVRVAFSRQWGTGTGGAWQYGLVFRMLKKMSSLPRISLSLQANKLVAARAAIIGYDTQRYTACLRRVG